MTLFKLLNTREQGNQLEDFAVNQLIKSGCKIIQRNFQCKLGEIDIIAMDGNILIFVEVRYRKQQTYGGAMLSVDQKKQRKIINTANFYLQKNQLTNKKVCRFDVFAIQGKIQSDLSKPDYNWIKQAFDA